MSAIGGIFDLKGLEIDFDILKRMRLALSLRGRNRSSAFLCGCCGMLFNGAEINGRDGIEGVQPMICERRGRTFSLCLDGDGQSAEAVMEAYLVGGVERVGSIRGQFSLSLYDGERNMLMLVRDKSGGRPLYYSIDGSRVLFASEIKGISAATDSVSVDRDSLIRHLTAPPGGFCASRLYSDIREVMPGECVLFTRVGMSRFFYRERRDGIIKPRRSSTLRESLKQIYELPSVHCEERLNEALCDALLAFDRPEFDCQMMGICELLRGVAESGGVVAAYRDGSRRRYPLYAAERDDRLGNLYGVRSVGVLSREDSEPSRGLYTALRERMEGMPSQKRAVLSSILGAQVADRLLLLSCGRETKKEDTEENIRILGMLYQTVEWAESARLVLYGQSSELICRVI